MLRDRLHSRRRRLSALWLSLPMSSAGERPARGRWPTPMRGAGRSSSMCPTSWPRSTSRVDRGPLRRARGSVDVVVHDAGAQAPLVVPDLGHHAPGPLPHPRERRAAAHVGLLPRAAAVVVAGVGAPGRARRRLWHRRRRLLLGRPLRGAPVRRQHVVCFHGAARQLRLHGASFVARRPPPRSSPS